MNTELNHNEKETLRLLEELFKANMALYEHTCCVDIMKLREVLEAVIDFIDKTAKEYGIPFRFEGGLIGDLDAFDFNIHRDCNTTYRTFYWDWV